MKQFLLTILNEQGFTAFLLIIIIIGVGIMFYKGGKILISMLEMTLTSFLREFKDMVKSIKILSDMEIKGEKKHTQEHNKMIEILNDIRKKIQKD